MLRKNKNNKAESKKAEQRIDFHCKIKSFLSSCENLGPLLHMLTQMRKSLASLSFFFIPFIVVA